MVAFPLIILGLTLTAVGTVILLHSLQLDKRESKSEHRGLGVILVGPIPFIFGGVRKAFMVIFALVALLLILVLAMSTNPSVIGW